MIGSGVVCNGVVLVWFGSVGRQVGLKGTACMAALAALGAAERGVLRKTFWMVAEMLLSESLLSLLVAWPLHACHGSSKYLRGASNRTSLPQCAEATVRIWIVIRNCYIFCVVPHSAVVVWLFSSRFLPLPSCSDPSCIGIDGKCTG